MDYRLGVDRAHLIQGLTRIREGVRRLKYARFAILGFDGTYLTIEVNNVVVLAQATGAWPGNARVSPALLAALAANPPAGDPIILTCDGSRLRFGPVTIDCHWQPISTSLLKIPPVRDWVQSLALAYTQPRGFLSRDGLTGEVTAAERKLDSLIAKVANSLAPVGVTEADIRALVERRLIERFVENGET